MCDAQGTYAVQRVLSPVSHCTLPLMLDGWFGIHPTILCFGICAAPLSYVLPHYALLCCGRAIIPTRLLAAVSKEDHGPIPEAMEA